MKQLLVKKVDYYGDETAAITLESEKTSIEVFCHLGNYQEGDKVENLLHPLEVDFKSAYLSDWPDELKKEKSQERLNKSGPYAYSGCGKVIDKENNIIEVCGFRIELNDSTYCDSIEFEITRLDLW